MTPLAAASALDAWIDAHFDEEVRFLQALVRVPTDTPPGDNAPHAQRTAALLAGFGFDAESHSVPDDRVRDYGLRSLTNLVVRRHYSDARRVIGLNAHGDVVPPGEGWTHDPYGGEIVEGRLYGRASAVSKSDFATFVFATRAIETLRQSLGGGVELYFTYDEEFGGTLGPGWLLEHGLARCDLLVAAGFSYQVITAHSGCLQMEVTVHGRMGHAAVPDTAIDALQGAVAILNALYARNVAYRQVTSGVTGIVHPYINVGRIEGGTNTNVVPGTVMFKLDRRMIPEEDPAAVEREIRDTIAQAAATRAGIRVDIRRLLLAHPLKPLAGNAPLVDAIRRNATQVFGEEIPVCGTPLYTDARLFSERGIPAVIYGAGPRTVLESNAKRADEHLDLEDLRRATQVMARSLFELLSTASGAA
jgi:acetylornithine deacetylase/succinyl-diaminopimelate desuccinylase-like protein